MSTGDEGGDPACWAHTLEDPLQLPDDTMLAGVLADLPEAVIISDADGRVTFWNRSATRILGWTRAEMLGSPLEVLIPAKLRAQFRNGFFDAMRTGQLNSPDASLSVLALDSSGGLIRLGVSVAPLRIDGSHRLAGAVALLRLEDQAPAVQTVE